MNNSNFIFAIVLIPACIAPPANFASSPSDKQSQNESHSHIKGDSARQLCHQDSERWYGGVGV